MAKGLAVGNQMSKSMRPYRALGVGDPEHRVFGGDAPQLVVGRVGRDAVEESPDLELPAPEIGPQHRDLVVVAELVGAEGLDPSAHHELAFAGDPEVAHPLASHPGVPPGSAGRRG